MNKEFIPYEQALELKELGFDIPSISSEHGHVWENEILYQQAFRWFREKYELYHSIIPKKSYPDDYVSGSEFYAVICGSNGQDDPCFADDIYTYEEAELACLKKLIEIAKQK